MKKKVFWSAIFGNIMDHYDVAIYAFLAPVIAPLFFENNDPTVSIIVAYGLMSLGVVTRPLGAFIFGKMAVKKGATKTLIIILLGMTASTISIGLIPEYSKIGVIAPILLVILRVLQSIFAAGEVAVASMYIFEDENKKNLGRLNSFYSCSTMIGISLASFAATLVNMSNDPDFYWRYAFFASLVTATPALLLRLNNSDKKIQNTSNESVKIILTNKATILKIIIVSSFSHMTYALPFVFITAFVPSIMQITKLEMLQHNSLLTIFDIILIIIFGIIIDRFRASRIMALMSGLLALTIIPAFCLIPHSSIFEITLLRIWIIVLGVIYSNAFGSWLFNLVQGDKKYLVTGVGCAIGTELLGRNTTVVCWSLYYFFQDLLAPAIFIALLSIVTCITLLTKNGREDCIKS